MTTENHTHDPVTGEVIAVEQAAEHVAETEVEAAAEVEIEKIRSDTAIQLAKIESKTVDRDLEAELAAALAEIELLKTAKLPPDGSESAVEATPAPTVIVADSPAPEPAESLTDPPARADDERPARVKHRDGWFGERA